MPIKIEVVVGTSTTVSKALYRYMLVKVWEYNGLERSSGNTDLYIHMLPAFDKLEIRSRFKGKILLSDDDPTICNTGLLFLSQGSLVKIVPLEILDGIEL